MSTFVQTTFVFRSGRQIFLVQADIYAFYRHYSLPRLSQLISTGDALIKDDKERDYEKRIVTNKSIAKESLS